MLRRVLPVSRNVLTETEGEAVDQNADSKSRSAHMRTMLALTASVILMQTGPALADASAKTTAQSNAAVLGADAAASSQPSTTDRAANGASGESASKPLIGDDSDLIPPPPAALSQKWPIDHDNPERSVPTAAQRDKNPLEYGYHLMDLIEQAEYAIKKGDKQTATKYYRAVAKAAPEMSVAFTKLCDLYEAIGDREQAAGACAAALSRRGASLADYQRFVRLTLAKEGPLTPQETKDVRDVIQHLSADPNAATKRAATQTQCQLGTRTDDRKLLEECVATLRKSGSNSSEMLMYEWALAMVKKDFREAEGLLEKAKTGGAIGPEGINRMMQATAAAQPAWRRWLGGQSAYILVAALTAVALGIGVTWAAQRRVRLRNEHAST